MPAKSKFVATQTPIETYESLLASDLRWAMSEGSLFFENKGAVQESLRRIVERLNELGIPYAVAGGMALFHHGYRRFTEDVDILVTLEGLKAIHKALNGLGYVRPFERSKNLRDTQSRVKIDFLITGEYPGDGKTKSVRFPDPEKVAIECEGIRFLNLSTLVELKLASKRYVTIWRNKFLTIDAKSLDEMIDVLDAARRELEAMRADGVTLDPDGGTGDDYAHLVTTDPNVAKKYGMEDESEFWNDDDLEDQSDGEAP